MGIIYETEEGLGGKEDDDDNDDDDPDRPEEPEVENDPAPPPDYDPDQDHNDDEETIILDEDEEGPEEEEAGGGHVDPVGATETTPASMSSEVREAINQAYLVSEGKIPPAKTINIAPFPISSPRLLKWSPPPLISPRALSQRERGLIKKAVAKALKPRGAQQQVHRACPQLLWCSRDFRFGPAPTSTASTASSPAPRPGHPPFHWWELATPCPASRLHCGLRCSRCSPAQTKEAV